MKFKVLTLFPEMIRNGLENSIIGRALENNLIELETVNIRDYSLDKHGKVDDYTYGGGAGMLMQAQPVYDAWKAQADTNAPAENRRTIYVTPQGRLFTQAYAAELAKEGELIFLCGHYEGIDQRVLDEIVTDYVSVGDYVLTGGELPAMVMIDAISRLVPGVLHNEESARTESFYRNLLEYPQFSRPEIWHDKKVPEVLLSGDHRKIAAWRLEQSERITQERRPDLYAEYERQEAVIRILSREKRLHIHMIENLRRGRGDVLFFREGAVCIYDPGCRTAMFTLFRGTDRRRMPAGELCESDMRLMTEMLESIPDKIKEELELAVTTEKYMYTEISNSFCGKPVQAAAECRLACYTQRNPLPVKHKDIRVLGTEYLDYLVGHYERDSEAYLMDRVSAGAFYGAFAEERIVGAVGWNADGSIGFLYVEKNFRRQGIGASLEAYCINRQLEMGYVPYGYICRDDRTSLRMQEKLGLYLSDGSVWRLEF